MGFRLEAEGRAAILGQLYLVGHRWFGLPGQKPEELFTSSDPAEGPSLVSVSRTTSAV